MQNETTSHENDRNGFFLPESLKSTGSLPTGNSRENFYCLSIIGQVEGHFLLDEKQKATKYDHLIPLLVALEESEDIDGILILLNTIGGDVEAGLAMAEVIASLKKPTVSIVLGGGHSIGVPLAVAAKRSFIVKSATMTLHPVRTTGTVLGVSQAFDYLKKMQDRIADFIVEHSHMNREELYRLLLRTDEMASDIGSVLNGTQAVECGLIDQVGGISEALDCLRMQCRSQKEAENSASQKKHKQPVQEKRHQISQSETVQ